MHVERILGRPQWTQSVVFFSTRQDVSLQMTQTLAILVDENVATEGMNNSWSSRTNNSPHLHGL